MSALNLNLLFGNPLADRGPTTTFIELGTEMLGSSGNGKFFAPIDRRSFKTVNPRVITGLPSVFNKLPYKVSRHVAEYRVEHLFEQACLQNPESIAYLWSDTSLGLAKRLNQAGVTTIREKIACGREHSFRVLRQAYEDIGALDRFSAPYLTPEYISLERQEFLHIDYFFCASPEVSKSLIASGCAPSKIINSSYGFDPARFSKWEATRGSGAFTFLYVGYICVGKGAHLVLDAWKKAKVKGKLILVGSMEPLIAERYADILKRDDVEWVPFTKDVERYYKSADVFVFPSLSEGGPQVTYEAGACGLPSIVTPMGAGAFVRDGLEGRIVKPGCVDVLTESFVEFEGNRGATAEMGLSASIRAKEFSWAKVGAARRALVSEIASTTEFSTPGAARLHSPLLA